MPTYSSSAITFIILQCISLILIIYLIIIILKSKPHFTKWTLFQICIAAFGNGFTNLPLIIIYGDELMNRAFETPLCIVLQKLSLFFYYPLQFFSSALAFYLWYALVKRDLDIEKKSSKYISFMTWTFTTVFGGILLESSSRLEHWGVVPSDLTCKYSNNPISIYGYIVTTSILDLLVILLSFHSMVVLWKRQMNFSTIQNRRTAIRLGESVRLFVWCFTVVILTTLPLVPRAIQNDSPISNYINISQIANFSTALDGIFLFMIFATDRKAAVFLPCYYVPPEKGLVPQYSFADERIDTINLSDQLSQMSNAHLRQSTYDHWVNDETLTEECHGVGSPYSTCKTYISE